MFNTLKKTLIGGAMLGLSSVALAVPVTFDFLGGNLLDLGDPLLFSEEGLELSVTGAPGISVDGLLGLGVVSGLLDNPEIDSDGPNESLNMLFSEEVQLLEVGFSLLDFDDSGVLLVNGSEVLSGNLPGSPISLGFGSLDVSGDNFFANNFGFTVEDPDRRRRENSYAISYITVDRTVPEPASLVLMALGLIGFGAASRKRAA